MTEVLRPYVPRPVVDWLRDRPGSTHSQAHGTLVFADISGFTTLTEQLARQGYVGAEEMGDILNVTFGQLLVPAYDYGAALIKWGGDAALLLFTGDDHAGRACRAAWEMQRVIRRIGRLRTSNGSTRLRMSIGIHSGVLDFFLVGHLHREYIVTGPSATTTTSMERVAAADEIVISAATAAVLPGRTTGEKRGDGFVLASAPDAALEPMRLRDGGRLPDLSVAVSAPVRDHVLSGAVEGEHRHVTTAFVQFLGTDRLLASAPAREVAAALAEVVDLIETCAERHEVTFLGTDIAPDGGKVMLVAGAPRNRDRGEERMLCTLREILDAPTSHQLRVGVASGRAFTGDFGPRYRRTYSVVGDSVNLAARLMAHAAPGELLATPDVVQRSRVQFRVSALEPFAVKGKADPVSAMSVGPVAYAQDARAEVPVPLIGREAELAICEEELASARSGHGSAIEIVGAAGVGKSRLVDELARVADADRLLRVGCDGQQAMTPYSSWRRLLTKLLCGDEAAENLREALATTISSRCPQLERWLPLIGEMLDLTYPLTPEVAAVEDRFKRPTLARVVGELLTALVDRPTVIVFEDVHLMDDASAEILRACLPLCGRRPWLLVTTRRPVPGGFVAGDGSAAVRLEVPPLTASAAGAVVEAFTDDDPLPPHAVAEIVSRGSGNPLFLRELALARRRVASIEVLPDTLEAVLTVAIDTLPPDQRRILRTAAVLGTRFDRRLLTTLLSLAGGGDGTADWRLLGTFLDVDDTVVRFRDSLTREAAYEALPFRRRLQLHAWAGEAIERSSREPSAEDLAALSFHFFNAQRFEVAARYSRLAADRARAHYANVEAAVLYERALHAARAAGFHDEDQRSLAEALGDVWYALGDLDKARTAYRDARRHAGTDPLARGRLQLQVARILRRGGRPTDALRALSRGIRDLEPVGSDEARSIAARMCACYAQVRFDQGRPRETIRWAEEAIRRAEAAGARDVVADASQYLDLASITLGRYEHGAKVLEALAIWDQLGDQTRLAGVLNHLGTRAYYQGDWTHALQHYARARDVLERIGDQWNAAIAAVNIAELKVEQGRLAEATELAQRCLRAFKGMRTPTGIAFAATILARADMRAARYHEALGRFGYARTLFDGDGDEANRLDVEARTVECMALAGRSAEALRLADEVAQRMDGRDVCAAAPVLQRARGLAHLRLRRWREAADALRHALDLARSLRIQPEVARALDALAALAEHTGRPADPTVVAERDALFARLGIVDPPHVGSQRPMPVIPAQAGEEVVETV